MLGYKPVAMGLSTTLMRAFADPATGISAAGSSQGTATKLDNAACFISTVPVGSGVALSINAFGGDFMYVYNGGANPVKVYPQSGSQINALGTNNPMILAAGAGCLFFAGSTTQWGALLSA